MAPEGAAYARKIADAGLTPDPPPPILPGNRRAWGAYGLIGSCLNYAGMGALIGFDWTACAELLKLYGLWDKHTVSKLKIIEGAFVQYSTKEQRALAAQKKGRPGAKSAARPPRRRR